MSGHAHAHALAACDRGVKQAEKDFACGRLHLNPFPPSAPMQRIGWDARMRTLICQREHGIDLCCQEHRQHRSQAIRSFRDLSCCADCAAEVVPRIEAEIAMLDQALEVLGGSGPIVAVRVPRQRARRG